MLNDDNTPEYLDPVAQTPDYPQSQLEWTANMDAQSLKGRLLQTSDPTKDLKQVENEILNRLEKALILDEKWQTLARATIDVVSYLETTKYFLHSAMSDALHYQTNFIQNCLGREIKSGSTVLSALNALSDDDLTSGRVDLCLNLKAKMNFAEDYGQLVSDLRNQRAFDVYMEILNTRGTPC